MEPKLSAALTALLRAVTAVDEELELIANAHPRDGFPHKELVRSLPSPHDLHPRAVAFAEEVLEDAPDNAATTFTATSKHLATLHTAAQGLRSAVEWASTFTAIDWWVGRRVSELGLPQKQVLVAPGRLGEFSIEPSSRFLDVLSELGEAGRLLSNQDGELVEDLQQCQQRLRDIHLLRVPPSDGISPSWHPLIIGHELAHLKYTGLHIRKWTGRFDKEGERELVGTAIEAARDFAEKTGGDLITRSEWIAQLERWLTEVACDSVAVWLYGRAGLKSLETVLSAYAVPQPTESHPPPQLRMDLQTATGQSELEHHRPDGDPFRSSVTRALDALLDLGLRLRDGVREELESHFGAVESRAEEVSQNVEQSLSERVRPPSSDWPEGDVNQRATAIESGLVRGLWRRRADLVGLLPGSEEAMRDDVGLVSEAIDALEFAARFDSKREDLGVEARERMPIPSVLWLTSEGVLTDRQDGKGSPAHDLRLGRHFKVFQRSSVSGIDTLPSDVSLSAIQRNIQVGWGDHFVLHPAELVLAATFEWLCLDTTCCAQVLSRSSLGRMGLLSATAVQVQPGYRGCLTLELVNLANVPLRLSPGQRIAQVVPIHALGATDGYGGDFQFSGPQPRSPLAKTDWDGDVLRGMRETPL